MSQTSSSSTPAISLNIAVMTVSDTRTEEDDKSGDFLIRKLTESGHKLAEKCIVTDNRYKIREVVSRWIADDDIHAVITTGGTGLTGRDITPEAIQPLFDKTIDGFGEIFRMLSYESIKTSTIQSRAFAGLANATAIFCLPGSTGACKDGWEGIIKHQLNVQHTPCNLVGIMPRFKEAE